MAGADPGHVGFQYLGRIADCHRNDGTAGFFRHFQAAFVKWKKIQFTGIGVSGSFRENAHGNAVFDLGNAGENRLKPLFNVRAVQK